mmetsp:Transcript_71713/g.149685  ORF Transcript_71713/g.149685 Transcript_71713/m.149685 type:complete len:482 (-) Transcript_71713:98-1543(-)|eukprot:CAMPEP_0181299290 /NCGR_PEP_ID=MMETSP1101-20121128/6264_1 /TAXON_ID=46948 /ORGANISM="Rhodomonas abbreviata, Strain Caron Lab Isolate" /LENGTH=481 /DNA_ID=CAMNT_0023404423 /DNA_START=295 /DNA_END=1743 /DNA_ORIENTATION=+
MCSALCFSTALLIPAFFLSFVSFKFFHNSSNEAVVCIKHSVEVAASHADHARDLLYIRCGSDNFADVNEIVHLRERGWSQCSNLTGEFEQAISEAIHASVDVVFEVVPKLFSWNVISVLGLAFDKKFQLRMKEVLFQIFELVKIKSEGKLEEMVEQHNGNVSRIFYVLEENAVSTTQPHVKLLAPPTELILEHVVHRGNEPELLERVKRGICAKEVWEYIFEKIGDDKSDLSKQLKPMFTEDFCCRLRDVSKQVAEPLVTDLTDLYVMFTSNRFEDLHASETLATFGRDFDLAYAAVEIQASDAAKRTLQFVKTYADIYNKEQILEKDFFVMLEIFSDPFAFFVEIKDAVKEVAMHAAAARSIRSIQLLKLEAEANALELQIKDTQHKEDQHAGNPASTTMQDDQVQGEEEGRESRMSESPTDFVTPDSEAAGFRFDGLDAREKLPLLRLQIREVAQRNVCDVVKRHALEAFPEISSHCKW